MRHIFITCCIFALSLSAAAADKLTWQSEVFPDFTCTRMSNIDKIDMDINGVRINNLTARQTTYLNIRFSRIKTFEISYSVVNRSPTSIYISGEFILLGEANLLLAMSASDLFLSTAAQTSQTINDRVIADPNLSQAQAICMRFKVRPE